MINAEEHKKLLAQIAELEENSVNYFDVEKEFFLIDSNNLAEVKTHLYGYSIQATGIYEQDNLTEDAAANLDGRGCYVYVEARDGQITIKQDLNGCWGIYLFRHGDYFALSNSFFRLLDHVKFKYPLTVNRDYCHYILINDVSSHAYSETAVNEVRLVERNAVLHIDIAKKNLEIELIDYREHTISLDSEEGIAILDRWVELWGNVLRGIAQYTKFIQTDLSGGFDSRITLLALLNSGIDLNKIRVNSIKGTVHTFAEDYDIASQIAEYYGFKLNQPLPASKTLTYSLCDIFNFTSYGSQTFSNLPKLWSQKNIDKDYRLDGNGGETIRSYWFSSPSEFINRQCLAITRRYSKTFSKKLSHSVEIILESGFRAVQEKYGIQNPDSPYLTQYLYQETRCRHHFGKGISCNCLKNTVSLSPTLDPDLRTLKLETAQCSDANLLMALLFTRFEPDLLKFPFQGKRSIAPETIAYAQKINARFPRSLMTNNANRGGGLFNVQTRDLQAEKLLSEDKNNLKIPGDLPNACLKATFESSRTYGLFTAYFDEELYRYAADYYDTHVFGRERLMYSIVGITRVIEDVEISQRNHPLYQDMKRFLEQDFYKIPNNAESKTIHNYFSARLDIQKKGTTGDFQILSVSDDKANVQKPEWFQKSGIGYQIQSYAGTIEVIAKATTDGQILLFLKGLDVRDPEDNAKRIPQWIDYTKLTVNGKVIFDKRTPAWHDKPYIYTVDAKADDEIKIQAEWLPHKSDSINDEYNALIVDKFKDYFSARLDIQKRGTTGDFQILSVSDKKASVRKPSWFQKGGIGYQIQSYAGTIEVIAKATTDGQISLNLKGLDVRAPEDNTKRIPYWIDYTKFAVNGKVIFDKLTPAWHDKYYQYALNAKAGDEIKIQVEWLPHRSDV